MNLLCSDKAATEQARAVLIQHGVRADLIKEDSFIGRPGIYLTVNQGLSAEQDTQICDALRRIAGVTIRSYPS
jgi:hypothetical protein